MARGRPRWRPLLTLLAAATILLGACTGSANQNPPAPEADLSALNNPARRYSAEWLINTSALELDVASPIIYREVVDDLTGTYLVESPNHLVLQTIDEVVLCAAISRVPLDPYCAASPRADGAPYVLAYPIQLVRRDWSPTALYDLAGDREVSWVAARAPNAWGTRRATAAGGFPIECFLVTGETTAAAIGFEICFTDDDLHLVASVDLQNDLVFEIDLLSYERVAIADDFETGLEDFVEKRPGLQEQLLELYPEIPAPRPTPTPG